MTKHELETGRVLSFQCPKCGHEWLRSHFKSEIQVDEVCESGYVYFGTTLHDAVIDYHCAECGFVIADEDGKEITDRKIAHWLMTHCPQEDSESELPEGSGAEASTSSEREK